MMIPIVCAVLFHATKPMPKVAVALLARIYFKPGDRRLSRHTVYLCGLHGENRRRVPEARGEIYSIFWKDAVHLRWISGGENEDPAKEIEFDLRTRKTRVIKVGKDIEWQDTARIFSMPENGIDSPLPSHPGRFGVNADGNAWTLTVDGKAKNFTLDGTPRGVLIDKSSDRLWFYNWTHNSTDGSWYWIYLFDWIQRKPILKIGQAGNFDFNPRRKIYAAVSPRGLSPYQGKRTVWVAKAWTGNWETGKTWTILDGLAEATDIALRP